MCRISSFLLSLLVILPIQAQQAPRLVRTASKMAGVSLRATERELPEFVARTARVGLTPKGVAPVRGYATRANRANPSWEGKTLGGAAGLPKMVPIALAAAAVVGAGTSLEVQTATAVLA